MKSQPGVTLDEVQNALYKLKLHVDKLGIVRLFETDKVTTESVQSVLQ